MKKNNEKGQTLLEAMLAVTVISIVLVGFLSRSSFNYAVSRETFDRNIAVNLARESIEAVRSIRDSNWLKGCPDPSGSNCFSWNSGLLPAGNHLAATEFDFLKNEWKVNFKNGTFDECVDTGRCRLFLNENGVYSLDPATAVESKFSRGVEINPICSKESSCGGDGICTAKETCSAEVIGLQIVSLVRWQENNKWKNARLEERLYNWR
ncbi:type II secretion system GspH family protein [Patescibacteria group bacterium]|nr:type II secretion system GspH family protein [Patescibacteria group bacterium]